MSHLAVLESDDLEVNYQAAKKRLQAAQQEKLEAAAEFLDARAALRLTLETLWPSPASAAKNSPLPGTIRRRLGMIRAQAT